MIIDSYFIFFTCGLAFIMAVSLLFRGLNFRTAHVFVILLAFSYIQAVSYFVYSDTIGFVIRFLCPPPAFGILFGPLIYFYVLSFTDSKTSYTRKDLLHYIPFIIMSIASLRIMVSPVEQKLIFFTSKVYLSDFSFFVLGCMFVFILYLIASIKKVMNIYVKENPVHKKIIKVLIIFASWVIFLIIKIVGIFLSSPPLIRISTLCFSLQVIIFFIAMQKIPFLLNYGILSSDKKSKSQLENIDIDNLRKELSFVMEEEKLYCDEDLNLNRLSRALDVTPHQLSEFLNEHYGKNFNAYINGYRIEYACNLLKENPESSTLSVAFASGFNSYSAFYSAFRKIKGNSPGNFKVSSRKT